MVGFQSPLQKNHLLNVESELRGMTLQKNGWEITRLRDKTLKQLIIHFIFLYNALYNETVSRCFTEHEPSQVSTVARKNALHLQTSSSSRH